MFFLHEIGRTRLKNLKKSVQTNGLVSQSHGNKKHTPHNATSLSSTEFFVRFLLNYAEQNGILLPGRGPWYSRSDIKLLPSSVSKRTVWRVYEAATQEDNTIRAVAYSTFCRLWRSPSIKNTYIVFILKVYKVVSCPVSGVLVLEYVG